MGNDSTASAPALIPLWSGFSYKEHQVAGIRWMLQRESSTAGPKGGLLADEMGLGKTIQMAGLLLNATETIGEQNLLVAPVAVLQQWRSVLERVGMGILVPSGKRGAWSWKLVRPGSKPMMPQVHLIGYETLTTRSGLGRLFKWDRVIFDEAQRLSGGKIGNIARALHTEKMWLLSATPIVNSEKDLVNLLEIVGLKEVPSNVASCPLLIKKYVMARTMEQLRASIPDAPKPAIREVLKLDFDTEEEADFYRGMTGMIVRRWKAIEEDGFQGGALERLKLFMRLRQLSLHPQVYIAARKAALKSLYTRPDWFGSSTKFESIRCLVTGAKEGGPHKWIVFCHFAQEMEMLKKMFEAEPSVERVGVYNGAMSAAQKDKVIAATHTPLKEEGKHEVLLIQLQSGGVGLNLQHFDRIIFTGPWWTKALMEQAVGRAVRIGQKNQVVVYNMILKEEEALNIDNYMVERAEMKGALCSRVLQMARNDIK